MKSKGNPASAKPMPGLSKRAQALLRPVRNQVVLEPKGSGLRREAMRKAGI
jgi:hypothetical protein